ncbi:MAG TPA: peptidoglycan-binding protein [Chthoniobacterales bacterium]|nr:peptidoglycan-binding protein [Chthoniobacterales bacterium]
MEETERKADGPLMFKHKAGNTLASAIAGGGILVFLMIIIFVLQEPNGFQRQMLRFFVALCAALFAHFFIGGVVLQGSIAGSRIGAGGGFALFVLVLFVVDPLKAQTVVADAAPSLIRVNPRIVEAQKKLKDVGLLTQGASGVPTSETRSAIREFQKSHGLAENGYLDPETRDALAAAEKKTSRAEGETVHASDEQKVDLADIMKKHGLKNAVSTSVIFDTLVHLGPARTRQLADSTTSAINAPTSGTSEKKWLLKFMDLRREWTKKSAPEFYKNINEMRLTPLYKEIEALPE